MAGVAGSYAASTVLTGGPLGAYNTWVCTTNEHPHSKGMTSSGKQDSIGRKKSGMSDAEQPLLGAGACESSVHPGDHTCNKCSVFQTTAALLTLQLGWGLWLLPCDFARLGWIGGFVCLGTLATLTSYSGHLFTRLHSIVPRALLFGDIGEAAQGRTGRSLVYLTIYSLDATRCIILHLAASQSLYHALAPTIGAEKLPLWQCSIVVAMVVLLLGQMRYLTQLSWFFMTGTVAQLVALVIVVYDLIAHPGGNPPPADAASGLLAEPTPVSHDLYLPVNSITGDVKWAPSIMAVLNMIFAFGGQFAFLEIINSMNHPHMFTYSVTLCTAAMTLLYGGLGSVGYYSKGSSMHSIVIFNLQPGLPAQIAAGLIFVQALAQYLVNLNVWTHNLLVLVARASRRAKALRRSNAGGGHLVQEAVRSQQQEVTVIGEMDEAAAVAATISTGDHHSSHWLGATVFVATYSAIISVLVPFFCTLVGLVTSVTYLTCAYTLPAWFTLTLLKGKLQGLERVILLLLIPLSIIASVIGFVASIKTYITEAGGGEGM